MDPFLCEKPRPLLGPTTHPHDSAPEGSAAAAATERTPCVRGPTRCSIPAARGFKEVQHCPIGALVHGIHIFTTYSYHPKPEMLKDDSKLK